MRIGVPTPTMERDSDRGGQHLEAGVITLIGTEDPGRSVLLGLLAAGMSPAQVTIAVPDKNKTVPDRQQAQELADRLGLHTAPVWNSADSDMVVLAVPPAEIDELVLHIKPKIEADAVVVSCVPEVSIARIEGNLAGESAVVQVTPDATVLAGRRGTCMLAVGSAATEHKVGRVRDLLVTMADVVSVP
jgi:pyrroline-5-carboxylate reductase